MNIMDGFFFVIIIIANKSLSLFQLLFYFTFTLFHCNSS